MAIAGLFLLLVVLGVAVLAVRQRMKWRAECRAGAAKIYGELTEMYRGEHEYRVVSEGEFPGVDPAGYRRVRDSLTALGFRHLGSCENLTVTRVYPAQRTFMDSYVHADGLVVAGTYRMPDRQVVDFGTQIEDGRFLVTSNADIDKLTAPPVVLKLALPADSSVEALSARHRERVTALQEAEPAVRLLSAATLEDAIAALRRHSRVMSEYRRGIGYITEQELRDLGASVPEETVKRVWSEITLLRTAAMNTAAGPPPE